MRHSTDNSSKSMHNRALPQLPAETEMNRDILPQTSNNQRESPCRNRPPSTMWFVTVISAPRRTRLVILRENWWSYSARWTTWTYPQRERKNRSSRVERGAVWLFESRRRHRMWWTKILLVFCWRLIRKRTTISSHTRIPPWPTNKMMRRRTAMKII